MDNSGSQNNLPPNPPATPPPVIVEENKSNKKYIYFGIGIVILCLMFLGFIFFSFQNDNDIPENPGNVSPTTGQVSPTVSVRPEIRVNLIKGQETEIPGTQIKATYNGRNIPGQSCFDCEEGYIINLKNGEIGTILEFKCGGIVGGCSESEELFGYVFTVGEVVNDAEFELVLTPE